MLHNKTMPSTAQFLYVLPLLLSIASSGTAQQLFTDFESGSLQSWSLNGDTIELTGVPTWTEVPNNYRWVYFGADSVLDRNIDFEIPANSFLGDLDGHRFVWSYDQQNWSFFDRNEIVGRDFRFSNDSVFDQDRVFVAYSTPYSVTRVSEHVSELASNWFVSPTASANVDLQVGSVQDLPLYGYRITNPLQPPPLSQVDKTKIVLVGGNHSGEPGANYALEGFLDFLASDDDRAQGMRAAADFYVYPMTDPLGRSEGFYRGNSQNPFNDHNRFWDASVSGDNGGFVEIDILSAAMRADTGADVNYTLDFHGFFDSSDNFIFTDSRGLNTQFIQELLDLNPPIDLVIDNATSPEGILEFWAKTPQGLNSDFAFTPEFSPNLAADDLRSLGQEFALAMFAELGNPSFETSSVEIDTLSQVLASGTSDLLFDFNRDGTTNAEDRDFFISDVLGSLPGDTDLSGTVEFADFLFLSDNFGNAGGWGQGDFDGDGTVAFADFLALSGNFGSSAVVAVPEPNAALLMTIACVGFAITRRHRVI